MLVYQTSIQIYDEISIPRNWSKVKLCRAISLWLGLNGVKITQKVANICMHAYLSNGYPNLRSNFNYEKLVKSETSPCAFTKVSLEGSENSSKLHENCSTCLFI